MDRERAEVFLRRYAEAELRHALLDSGSQARWRVSSVGNALVRAGALDAGIVDAIDEDVEFALTVREPRPPRPRPRSRPVRMAGAAQHQTGSPRVGQMRAQSHAWATFTATSTIARPGSQPRHADSLIPLDVEIPLESGGERLVLYLLAFCQGGGGGWFLVHLRRAGPPLVPRRGGQFSSFVGLMNSMHMTDDTGASYQVVFRGGGNEDQGYHGRLDIVPDPSSQLRWVEITPSSGPAVRVDLTGTGASQGPAVTITRAAHSPGEYVLGMYAARLLCQGTLHVARLFGDIVTALRECGALPPHSPAPGQLARLCELHDVRDHGITSSPGRDEDLPEPWRIDTRWEPVLPYPRNGFAAATIALPELDGARLTILGLINSQTQTSLHILVIGAPVDHHDDTLPVLWMRDDLGGWHATFPATWNRGGGESRAELTVSPPLNRASAVDILAFGRSAEVRTTLPLRWR